MIPDDLMQAFYRAATSADEGKNYTHICNDDRTMCLDVHFHYSFDEEIEERHPDWCSGEVVRYNEVIEITRAELWITEDEAEIDVKHELQTLINEML